MPRLSILLPTRNGGNLLEHCLRSILDQDGDFELVVSDNANTDGTAEVLATHQGDPRLKTVRQAEPVPVVENWMKAFESSTGDYVLMMGDDDLLLPGYVTWIGLVLDDFKNPDCILYNAYSYVWPDAMAGLPIAHYADPHFRFGPEFAPGEFLSDKLRKEIVRDMFRFRVRIPLNMQTTVFSRSTATRVLGPIFRPPFPDHYAINAMLLTADRWAHVAHQPIVIGISPKSFGHFVYSNRQEAGLAYLGIDTEFDGRLPGNELLNAMYVWLSLLAAEFPDVLGDVEVSRRDYVARQVWAWFVQWRLGALEARQVLGLLRLLRGRDWADLMNLAGNADLLGQLWSRLRITRAGKAQRLWAGLKPLPGVTSIAEFAAWLDVQSGGG